MFVFSPLLVGLISSSNEQVLHIWRRLASWSILSRSARQVTAHSQSEGLCRKSPKLQISGSSVLRGSNLVHTLKWLWGKQNVSCTISTDWGNSDCSHLLICFYEKTFKSIVRGNITVWTETPPFWSTKPWKGWCDWWSGPSVNICQNCKTSTSSSAVRRLGGLESPKPQSSPHTLHSGTRRRGTVLRRLFLFLVSVWMCSTTCDVWCVMCDVWAMICDL